MRTTHQSFKRHYHLVKGSYQPLRGQQPIQLQLHANATAIQAALQTPEDPLIVRFVVLMRPLLDPASRLYYKAFWAELKQTFADELTEPWIADLDAAIHHVGAGFLGLQIDGEERTAEDVYHLLAEGEYFGTAPAAKAYLHDLMHYPIMGPVLWHQFYNYTLQSFHLVSRVYTALRQVEATERYGVLYPPQVVVQHCIYCGSTAGSFTTEEHVIPESLGNDDAVLPRGYVCDGCNNRASVLDEALCNILGMHRLQYVPYTKKGKLPQVKFENAHLELTRPHHIAIQPKQPGAVSEPQDLGDGRVAVSFHFSLGVQPELVARALCKVALAATAHFHGQGVASRSEYDAARAYIQGTGPRPGTILYRTDALPQGRFRLEVYDGVVVMEILGAVFVVALRPDRALQLNPTLIREGYACLG